MALARKGTRKIVVNGIWYRWRVSARRGWGDMLIAVECCARPGQRVAAQIPEDMIVPPWLVRRVIVRALAAGWRPEVPGPSAVFKLRAGCSFDGKFLPFRYSAGDYLPFRYLDPLNPEVLDCPRARGLHQLHFTRRTHLLPKTPA